MQDAVLVRRAEPKAELARDLQRLVRRRASQTPQHRREILPVDVLHDDEDLPVGLRDVVRAADVRMRDLPRDPDLLAEAREIGRVPRHALGKELERDRVIQLEVVRSIDLSHSAAPEQSDDAIARP